MEDKQSQISWQTINEVNKRKNTSRGKLKAASQEEWIHFWKENFKNLLGKSPKFTDKPFTKIINNQLDIKLGRFNQGKLADLMKYHQKYGRQDNSMTAPI